MIDALNRRMCALALFVACACSHARAAAPIPALRSAPAVIANASLRLETELSVSAYWEEKGVGRALARALERELTAALSSAGYQVGGAESVIDLRVSASLFGSTTDLSSRTVLEISRDRQVIERFELRTPDLERRVSIELYPRYVSASLVNALSDSPTVAALTIPPSGDSDSRGTQTNRAEEGASVVAFDILDAAENLAPSSREELTEYAAVRMAEKMGYRIAPRERLRERIHAAQGESFRACVDDACQIELGKALAAKKMVTTRLIRVGESCALTATVFDLVTEATERAASVKTACAPSSLFQSIDDLVEELRKVPRRVIP